VHPGTWQHYQDVPYITKDSQPASPATQATIDAFLTFFKSRILPKLGNIITAQYPELAEKMRRVSEYIRSFPHIQEVFQERPALDLGPLFTCAAVSVGGSDRTHIDWMDDPNLLAWVVPLGEFTESSICFPQLGRKYRIRPGDAFGLASRRLAHRAELPLSGRRLVVTLFTDRALV
ncbi:hypothetical protein K474DRAFT_1583929, partial [Panus rudis PR-1116 ss-1]